MMRMLKKIAGWSWKKKIIVIICVVLTLVLGAAGAVFGYAASKVNKIQKIEVKRTETDRIYQCCIIWSGFKRK